MIAATDYKDDDYCRAAQGLNRPPLYNLLCPCSSPSYLSHASIPHSPRNACGMRESNDKGTRGIMGMIM